MTVSVTAEDIAKGVRGNPSKCPVALALARIGKRLSLLDFYHLACKHVVFLFMDRFDNGEKVEPFEFELL